MIYLDILWAQMLIYSVIVQVVRYVGLSIQRTRVRFSAWALDIYEILFEVFLSYPTLWTLAMSRYDLKMPESCVSVLYTGHIKEPGFLIEVRARQMQGLPASQIDLSLLVFPTG